MPTTIIVEYTYTFTCDNRIIAQKTFMSDVDAIKYALNQEEERKKRVYVDRLIEFNHIIKE